MLIRTNSTDKLRRLMDEQRREEELEEKRMQDVMLLLEGLARREEPTIKMIMDCLYDVGTMNLINKKVRYRPLNRIMKRAIKLPKPAAKVVLFYWFRKNCPELITNWLRGKVRF
ncbi:hypothetical protein GS597_00770 [Synechococcales cyanobacterium C]|uniref:Uncharacterized protein n=1 Tax=Petrachloros mirabilis ULC683 TaxID=2781853 RepID=A0A8K1ZWC6_9CYAN|nr:hypothetical protein [Petrachloros mirabilis]NCJ05072.1 hypothetical protein [Petrachloros mirabilis ULC683]